MGQNLYSPLDLGVYDVSPESQINHLDVHIAEIGSENFKEISAEFKLNNLLKVNKFIFQIEDPTIRRSYMDKRNSTFQKSTGQSIGEFVKENPKAQSRLKYLNSQSQ